MVSRIKQLDENTWQAPESLGLVPVFHRYNNGHRVFGKAAQEDIVNPPPKPIYRDNAAFSKDTDGEEGITQDEFVQSGYMFASSQHSDYLDMRIDSVINRGKFIISALFFLAIWFIVKLTSVWQGESWSPTLFDWSFYIGTIVCFAWDLLRRAQLPVRFHVKNQEVYVYYRRVLYRIPWQECEMSVRLTKYHTGMGNMRDGYQLVLWLNSDHTVNKQRKRKYRRLVLEHLDDDHISPYLYWEYVRRFMAGELAYIPERSQHNIDTLKRLNIKAIFNLFFVYPIYLILKTDQVALKIDYYNPFHRRWPQEVHEWTGEKCNWR
ncbi:hypothetical protein [Celerinatantimonas diazotrophica]|uniref:Uncharacterized protein n=1 Tax=Celerinatantimonas diazotrophica TaxID=412034 RepID=A0A4R1KA84_9GAMM|nr:hypothetical protein [Celerinatantimonas diazotrophica]TCK60079.1 hypothetical protein EV690_0607 [Celerinatantimonas diazotrophica]CAG9295108.1 hypothetical protein CEDIAZO_00220 [Celerinatantimonas diazotrophica]